MYQYLYQGTENLIAQQVLIRLIEEWINYLDKIYVVGAILMDLSKAFDCVPHDLLIDKLEAYGFNEKALIYILSINYVWCTTGLYFRNYPF